MASQNIFERYIQMAEILGQMFQNILEVVVHDFKDIDHSIIHIVNGHISGRAIGGSVNELNMRRLIEEDKFPDSLVNYTSRNKRGQQLKSSSLAIRDMQGKLIGAFCLHFDLSHFEQFHKFLEFFVNSKNHTIIGPNENRSYDEEIKVEIESWLLKNGMHASQLAYKDKQAIVSYLYRRGCFNKKGAISTVAHSLQLTRQSIYNYLELAKSSQIELSPPSKISPNQAISV